MNYFISWNDTFTVYNDLLDEQHKELITILNMAYSCYHSKGSNEEIYDIIDSLLFFAEHHFKAEENYMRENNYSDIKKHIKQHQKLMQNIIYYNDQIEKNIEVSCEEVLQFIWTWFMNHVQVEDQRYAKSIQAKLEVLEVLEV